MANQIIEIVAEPRTLLPVTLVGVKYQLDPPKDAYTLELATFASNAQKGTDDIGMGDMQALIYGWIDQAFGDQAEAVRKRMLDPKDDLDLKHVMLLIQRVVEVSTGNPTS